MVCPPPSSVETTLYRGFRSDRHCGSLPFLPLFAVFLPFFLPIFAMHNAKNQQNIRAEEPSERHGSPWKKNTATRQNKTRNPGTHFGAAIGSTCSRRRWDSRGSGQCHHHRFKQKRLLLCRISPDPPRFGQA